MAFSTIQGSGAAPDSFVGTSGVDTILIQNVRKAVFLDGDAANDVIEFTSFTELVSGYTLKGGQGNDTFTAVGPIFGTNISGSFINGNAGNDLIDLSLVSSSTIHGGQGNDTFFADARNSILNGNAGTDTMNVFSAASSSIFGGQGTDVLNISGIISSSDINGDLGNDAINLTNAKLINSTISGGDGEDTIILLDTPFIFGPPNVPAGVFTSSNSTIFGGKGSDNINAEFIDNAGSTGVILSGDEGNDTLSGSAFADILFGGDGNDRIRGNAGADTMTGGAGVNTFVFVGAGDFGNLVTGAVDVITDFKAGDVISGGFVPGALGGVGGVGFATYAAAAAAADLAGGNFIAGVGTGTSFTAFLFNGGASAGTDLAAAVQLNGTGQFGSAALAQRAIVAAQIIA